jgi:hypothetical protein
MVGAILAIAAIALAFIINLFGVADWVKEFRRDWRRHRR